MRTFAAMRGKLGAIVATLTALSLAGPGPADAAITVTSTADSGPGSLRQAVADAPAGETIVLPAGTYSLSGGPIKFEKPLTIAGHDDADTRISGNHQSRVLEIFNAGGQVNLVDLTIADGLDDEGENAGGGGIEAIGVDLTLLRVGVTGNVADSSSAPGLEAGYSEGGGVFHNSGTLRVLESDVSGNAVRAVGGSGARGSEASGGGIYAGGLIEIADSTILGNVADARGGQGPASPGQDGGSADGAGVLAAQNEAGTARIVGSTFTGNVADASGGPGGEGGGVAGAALLEVSNEAAASIANSTFAGNVARTSAAGSVSGGGLYLNGGDPGTVTVMATTIAANRIEGALDEGFGGNLAASGLVSFGDTIVAAAVNGPPGSENCFIEDGPKSLGFNLDSTDQCAFHAPGDRVNSDPQLGPLALNGGPVQTMLPAPSSPAVDQGSRVGLATDARGVVRPVDFPSIPNSGAEGADGSDIGAVELRPSSAIALGKLTRNRKRGTARLAVSIPQPSFGSLMLKGRGLKTREASIDGQGTVTLTIAATGKAKKALRRNGKRKVGLEVTYYPVANSPSSATRKLKLIKKKHRHRKHGRHGKK